MILLAKERTGEKKLISRDFDRYRKDLQGWGDVGIWLV